MGDLDRQAANGCCVAVMLLMLVTIGVAIVAWTSAAMVILAALLVVGGLGLTVVAWAERG